MESFTAVVQPGPTGEMGPPVAEIMLQTAITTTSSKAFKLDCLRDFPSAGMYVNPGASIMIVKATGPSFFSSPSQALKVNYRSWR